MDTVTMQQCNTWGRKTNQSINDTEDSHFVIMHSVPSHLHNFCRGWSLQWNFEQLSNSILVPNVVASIQLFRAYLDPRNIENHPTKDRLHFCHSEKMVKRQQVSCAHCLQQCTAIIRLLAVDIGKPLLKKDVSSRYEKDFTRNHKRKLTPQSTPRCQEREVCDTIPTIPLS